MNKVLLVGSDILTKYGSGDKNFWLDLIGLLNKKVDFIILSINNLDEKIIEHGDIKIYNLKPVKLELKKNNSTKCHLNFHKNYIEKSLTIFKMIVLLKKIIKKEKIRAIHIIDNYGPLMYLFKLHLKNVKVTVNAVTYNPTSKIYDLFLKISLSNFDNVVTYSDSFKDILNKLNVKNVKTIHWGIIPTKTKIKCNKKRINILWSGYLQQTNEEDFKFSIDIAKKLIRKNRDIIFTFSFKPEHYRAGYKSYKSTNLRIITNQNFKKTIKDYDYLFCPILNKKSTLAPPLTWLECQNLGIPIITNPRKNINEIIISDYNGFLFNEKKPVDSIISFLEKTNIINLSENCKKFIKQNYNLKKITKQYQDVWNEKG